MKSKSVVLMIVLAFFMAIPVVHAGSDLCYEYYQQKQYDDAIRECTRQINGEMRMKQLEYSYNTRGNSWSAKKDYDRAIADYTKAIELDPKYTFAYNNRGLAYQNKEQYDQAITDYTKAIELDPKYVSAYKNRAKAYKIKRQYDYAIADYTKSIELDSKNASVFNNRGIVWYEKKDFDHAIADYNEAIRLNPQMAEPHHNRGKIWSDKGDHGRAIADYNEAIRLNPQFADAYASRGFTWIMKGEIDRAIADFTEALGLNPKLTEAFNNRGLLMFIKGDFSSAASDLAEVQRLRPDTDNAIWLYLARTRSGSDAKEELILNTNGMDDKKWPAPVVALFLNKAKPGTIISQAADPDPKTYKEQLCQANFYLGEWYLLHSEKKHARAYFTKAQNDCPKDDSEYQSAVAELKRLK